MMEVTRNCESAIQAFKKHEYMHTLIKNCESKPYAEIKMPVVFCTLVFFFEKQDFTHAPVALFISHMNTCDIAEIELLTMQHQK
jgi:hypothetical protein